MVQSLNSSISPVGLFSDKYRLIWISGGILALFIFSLLPPPEGLTVQGFKSLLILIFAVILWITELLHPAVTASMVIVLLSVMRVISFDKAIQGFADSSIALLVAVFVLSAAMVQSGLDKRLAYLLLSFAHGDSRLSVLMVICTMMLFTFLVPTAAGRAALMVPICLGMTNAMNLKQGSNIAKAMFLAVSFVSLIFSSAIMTGALSMVYATGLFQKVLGYSWNYVSWLTYMLPGAILSSLLTWLVLILVFPPEMKQVPQGSEYVKQKLQEMGSIRKEEKKVAFLFLSMVFLWITSFLHHLPVALIAVITAMITFFPGIELHKWKDAVVQVDWGTVIIFGGSLALATSLKETGAIEWITELAFGRIPPLSPYMTAFLVLVICILIRLGFTSVLAAMTVILPMTLAAAPALGVNPLWLGMISVIGSDLCLLLPTQSPTLLATYATGYYSMRDTLKAGLPSMGVFILVTLIMAAFYWPALGIKP